MFRTQRVQNLVYVSSTGAIPELPKGQKIKEVNEFDAEKVVGWYSKTKAMATQAVLDAVKKEGLNACVVHPSGILGPQDYAVGRLQEPLLKSSMAKCRSAWAEVLTSVTCVTLQRAVSQQPIEDEKANVTFLEMRK